MAQFSNEHLTITELSAYLDKELAPEELALCDAHIRTCQPCQAALADLRLTSALLSSMPQVAVPRSFALPTNLVALPETPSLTPAPGSGRSASLWQRSARVISALVAVLGLLLCLSGALAALPHNRTATSASQNSSVTSGGTSSQAHPSTLTALPATGSATPTSPHTHATPQIATPAAATPVSTPTSVNPVQQSGLPAILDLTRPAGLLSIGLALLIVGLLALLVLRLFPRPARR